MHERPDPRKMDLTVRNMVTQERRTSPRMMVITAYDEIRVASYEEDMNQDASSEQQCRITEFFLRIRREFKKKILRRLDSGKDI